MEDDNKLILERKRKLDRLKEKFNPYPNTFQKSEPDTNNYLEKNNNIMTHQ